MSSPRPIHIPSREILKEPHDSEPLHSYDDPSPLLDEEDDFHNRLSRSRRESSGSTSGGSFWRTSGDTPSFSSAQLKKTAPQKEIVKQAPPPPDGRTNRSPGLLANALQAQQTDSASSVSYSILF